MSIKNAIKTLLKSNPVTGTIYKKIAYARADRRELNAVLKPIQIAMREKPDAVFLVMTPEHGNLGDHAIASAEQKMLGECGIPYIEVSSVQLSVLRKKDRLRIMDGRVILVNGGGNLGTLWFGVEEMFRSIIRENPCSPILCLPNTIYYENSNWGREQLKKSIEIYNAHCNLKLYAREKISYEQMKPIYADVQLVPDMVMSLNMCKTKAERKGCLLCLRSDCEKTRTDEEESIVLAQARSIFGDAVTYTDMCVDHGILVKNREAELEMKFSQFRRAELVITDRLHGMIFCAITGTPCIVINSKSHKVKGCYDWISDLGYIQFCDDLCKISEIYDTIPQKEHQYHAERLNTYYDQLKSDLLRACGR